MIRIFAPEDKADIYPPGVHDFEYEDRSSTVKKVATIEIDSYYTITEIRTAIKKYIVEIDPKVLIVGKSKSISYKKYMKRRATRSGKEFN